MYRKFCPKLVNSYGVVANLSWKNSKRFLIFNSINSAVLWLKVISIK